MNKRVAICVSGQLRTFRVVAESLINNLVRPLNADVFVATWDDVGNTNKLILFMPRGFHLALPQNLWHSNPDALQVEVSEFESLFPKLYRFVQRSANSDTKVTAEEVGDFYKSVDVCVETFSPSEFGRVFNFEELSHRFLDRTVLNAVPMFYKIWQADHLRRCREIINGQKYDWVFRIRPDMRIEQEFDVADLSGSKIRCLHNPFYEIVGKADQLSNDMMFFGSGQAMAIACDLYRHLETYWDVAAPIGIEFAERGPERIFDHYLDVHGLKGLPYAPGQLPVRVVQGIAFSDMMACILSDTEAWPCIPEWLPRLVGLCHSTSIVDLFLSGRAEEAFALAARSYSFRGVQGAPPHAGLAKIRALQGENELANHHKDLAVRYGQEMLFPELFS